MKSTRDRILDYLEFKGINKKQFYEATGLSNGFLDKTLNPGADKLDKILTAYPDIDAYWLIGKDVPMLIAPQVAARIGESDKKMVPKMVPNTVPNEQKYTTKITTKLPSKSNLTDDNIGNLPKVVTVDSNDRDIISLVPVKAAAGYLNGYGDPEYIEKLPTLYMPGLTGATHRAFEIRGQSMMPNLHSGSICIGRWVESINDIKDRRVYIIVSKFDGIVVKRVLNRIKQDGKLIMISDNDNKKEYPNYPIDAEDVLEIWYWRGAVIREVPEPGTQYARFNDLEGRLSMLESRLLSGK